MKSLLTTSPRTGAWGLISAIGAFLSVALFEIPGAEDAVNSLAANASTWVQVVGGFFIVLGLWGMGHDARDNDKSSESVGAK
jgi:hypothetical protein